MTRTIRLDGVMPGTLSGLRADRALARLFPQYSRSRIQGWIRAGAVTLDGAAVRARDRIMGGERISIRGAVEADEAPAAQPGPLAVLHEDPDLLVLDKPPGLVVHPGAGNWSGTLLNRLLAYDPGLRAVPRAGLVHRLDKDTSGLMLVARSLRAIPGSSPGSVRARWSGPTRPWSPVHRPPPARWKRRSDGIAHTEPGWRWIRTASPR